MAQAWHGRWHRIAIAAIAERGQVLDDVGPTHSLTCGFAAIANILALIRIFKSGVCSDPAQAGSIPVRLRRIGTRTNVGATKYGWMHARDRTMIRPGEWLVVNALSAMIAARLAGVCRGSRLEEGR
jgi:hypothetical protein